MNWDDIVTHPAWMQLGPAGKAEARRRWVGDFAIPSAPSAPLMLPEQQQAVRESIQASKNLEFDRQAAIARAPTTPEQYSNQYKASTNLMAQDPTQVETATAAAKWQPILAGMNPANQEEKNYLDSKAYRDIFTASQKDTARNTALRNQIQSDYEVVKEINADAARGETGEAQFAQGDLERAAEAADVWEPANFIGAHANKPSYYAPWGELAVNPNFIFRPDKYTKAVEDDPNAPPQAKERAMQMLPAMQQQAAPDVFEGFLRAGGIHNKFQRSLQNTIKSHGWEKVYRGNTERMVENWTPEQKATAVQDFIASPDYSPNANQIYLGASKGSNKLQQQMYGIGSFFGSDAAQKSGEEQVRQQQVSNSASANAGGNRSLNTLSDIGTTLLPSIALGLMTDGVTTGLGASQSAKATSSLAANMIGQGAQTLGSSMIDAKQAGMSGTEARLTALALSASTAGLTKLLHGSGRVTPPIRQALATRIKDKFKEYGIEGVKDAFIDQMSDRLGREVIQNSNGN